MMQDGQELDDTKKKASKKDSKDEDSACDDTAPDALFKDHFDTMFHDLDIDDEYQLLKPKIFISMLQDINNLIQRNDEYQKHL